MKKMITLALIICTLISAFILVKQFQKQRTPCAAYTIGILQTTSHPALDAAREGFKQELERLLPTKVAFVINNAQGAIPQAHSIAQQFRTNTTFNLFFAIATPAAQALSAVEKDRPIVIAAVTDAHGLGLLHEKTNVCGTQDMVDAQATVNLISTLIPDVKSVGILYTTGEVNALAGAHMLRTQLQKAGITVTDFGIAQELDIAGMVESACRKVEVLVAPNDNTIASTIGLVASIAQKNKIPLFVSDPMLVTFGPLAAQGIDYTSSGAHAARIAYEVLVNGKKPYELPIENTPSTAIVINQKTADALGISIPDSIKNNATIV